MKLSVFEEVADALRSLLPPEFAEFHYRAHGYGIKVWFDRKTPPKAHYEAQVVGAKHVPDAEVLALEIGFHAEHRDPAENDALLATLAADEKRWRKTLGPDAVAGPFLGRPDDWRRLSETWADPDLSDPDLPFEVAAVLVDYITEVERSLRH